VTEELNVEESAEAGQEDPKEEQKQVIEEP
jgi:hypothetical protein